MNKLNLEFIALESIRSLETQEVLLGLLAYHEAGCVSHPKTNRAQSYINFISVKRPELGRSKGKLMKNV